ncbi:MAG: DUF3786 domain-containing protein [Euryarchaeota archaeon]|nr:DUF3786 domain-containing protein [Euryarchaeota archaeon]
MAEGGPKPFGYRAVADRAWDELAALDPADFMKRGGASPAGDGACRIKFFGRESTIDYGHRKVTDHKGGRANVTVEIVLLHYLLGASELPLSGRLRSFREFADAEAYQDAFRRRAIEPLAQAFGPHPERFEEAARALGGVPAGLATGDRNFRLPALPRLPVVCILWLGDDEVPSSAQVLFDDTAGRQVPVEDLAVVGEFAVYLLIEEAGLRSPAVGRIFAYG